ncbi:shikimate kinase [Halalkalibacillus halophilus]|uniref:shikimate kinase n=1 Tax=Halalkalibacillus halophilus TaxID=392827 RepID=UPI00040C380F|nr:shikimate kinase [Halalkalibacillus halophilus]
MKNIVIVGFMGSGKSVIGELVANDLHMPFVDMDLLIEKQEKKTISEIFRIHGEAYFRGLETQLLKDLSDSKSVISTGGGIVERSENKEILTTFDQVCFLKCSFATIKTRLRYDDSRPLWKRSGKEQLALFQKRELLYEEVASFVVETDNLSAEEVTEKVINYYQL